MRDVPQPLVDALRGSRAADRLTVTVTRGGDVLATNVDVKAITYKADASRAVHTTVDLTVVDDTGALSPWAPEDALGPGGSQITLAYQAPDLAQNRPGEVVQIGTYRITGADVEDKWRITYPVTGWTYQGHPLRRTAEHITQTTSVDVTAEDLTVNLDTATYASPRTIPSGATVLTELRAITADLVDVDTSAVTTAAIPAGYTHPDKRLQAVAQLLDVIQAVHVMTPDGTMRVLPDVVGDSVWDLDGGDTGVLLDISRSIALEDCPNQAVVVGKDGSDVPLIGTASLGGTDPLAVGGPHGIVNVVETTDLASTQAQVDALAAYRLKALTSGGVTRVPATCLYHPGIELYDLVSLWVPGMVNRLRGQVMSIDWQSRDGAAPSRMTLGLDVPTTDLRLVAALTRARQEL